MIWKKAVVEKRIAEKDFCMQLSLLNSKFTRIRWITCNNFPLTTDSNQKQTHHKKAKVVKSLSISYNQPKTFLHEQELVFKEFNPTKKQRGNGQTKISKKIENFPVVNVNNVHHMYIDY